MCIYFVGVAPGVSGEPAENTLKNDIFEGPSLECLYKAFSFVLLTSYF